MTDLDLFAAESSAPPPRGWRGVGTVFLAWLPVLAALALTAQIGIAGLRPALQEAERLERAEASQQARRERLQEETAALLAALQAQQDPIYLERERKMLLDPEPVLESSR